MGYTVSIDVNIIRQIINALKPKDKLHVLDYLEKDLWRSKTHHIVMEMRKHAGKSGITDAEIDSICEDARRKHHGRN